MIHCGFNLEFNYFSVHFWSPINLLTDQSLSLLPDDAYSSTYNYQTFEIVPEEANNEVYIVDTSIDSRHLMHVVCHEIVHAVLGKGHDEYCPLMASRVPAIEWTRDTIKKNFIKYFE